MSKNPQFNQYFTETAKWQAFLEATLHQKGIKVTKVTETDVVFEASRDIAKEVFEKLHDAGLLKAQVLHAIKTAKEADSKAAISEYEEINKILNLNGLDTLQKLLEPSLLKTVFGDLKKQQIKVNDDNIAKVMTFTYEATNHNKASSFVSGIETLNFMLGDKTQSVSIMEGKAPKFDKETEDAECEVSEFGKSLFKYTLSGKTASVTFNYGHLHAALQEDLHLGIPILVSENTDTKSTWSINKQSTLTHFGEIYNGLVFKDEDGAYRPIAFYPETKEFHAKSEGKQEKPELVKQSSPNFNFVFLVDHSSSLEDSYFGDNPHKWSKYITTIKKSLEKITKLPSQNLHVDLVLFNHELKQHSFDGQLVKNLPLTLDKLKADGKTDLYGAIQRGIDTMKQYAQTHANTHNILILFTDGEDTQKALSEDEVLNAVQLARKNDLQFQMYTVGLGNEYCKDFFDKIIKSGVTHIDARQVPDMSQLDMFIDTMSKEQLLFKFILESVTEYLQVAKGDIKVSQHLLSQKSIKVITSFDGASTQEYTFNYESDEGSKKDDSNPKLEAFDVSASTDSKTEISDYLSQTTSTNSQYMRESYNNGIEECNFDIPSLGEGGIWPSCKIM